MRAQLPRRFVVVAGPPCAGKSTVARHLSSMVSAPHLELDYVRTRILPLSDQRVEDRDVAYNAMHLAAELMAPWSQTVILDATYTAAVCRTALVDVAERSDADLFVIECRISAAAAVERFNQRGPHSAIDLTIERVESLAAAYPYGPDVPGVATYSEAIDLSHVAGFVSGPPLDRAARIAWSRVGSSARTLR